MRNLFIINPVAGGGGKAEALTAEITEEMARRHTDFEIYVTKGPQDATEKVRAEADTGAELRVFACGGDGTLNECVCGAAERPNVAVTHYPCGTGNDFIKTFGEEKARFFSLSELLDGEERSIDVIHCNDRYSVSICSVGIDARIGTNVHKYSRFPLIGGAGGYILSTAAEMLKGVGRPMRVIAGGRVFDGDKSLVCVCNGAWYGGFFNPVPEARPDDGLLDALIVRGVSRLTFARLVGSYAKGEYKKHPQYIQHLRTRSLIIDSPKELVVNLDGEALRAKRVEMIVVPGGLRFLFPRDMAYFKNQTEETGENERKQPV